MLSTFPMRKEDILEVASIAVHFETHFPTASKALLDKCTSLLASSMHTAENVARFAEQGSKDSKLAPLVVKLLARMGSCKNQLQELKEQEIVKVDQSESDAANGKALVGGPAQYSNKEAKFLSVRVRHPTVKRGDILSTAFKNSRDAENQVEVCLNCKAVKTCCRNGQEVRFVSPAQVETQKSAPSIKSIYSE